MMKRQLSITDDSCRPLKKSRNDKVVYLDIHYNLRVIEEYIERHNYYEKLTKSITNQLDQMAKSNPKCMKAIELLYDDEEFLMVEDYKKLQALLRFQTQPSEIRRTKMIMKNIEEQYRENYAGKEIAEYVPNKIMTMDNIQLKALSNSSPTYRIHYLKRELETYNKACEKYRQLISVKRDQLDSLQKEYPDMVEHISSLLRQRKENEEYDSIKRRLGKPGVNKSTKHYRQLQHQLNVLKFNLKLYKEECDEYYNKYSDLDTKCFRLNTQELQQYIKRQKQ